MVLQQIPQVVGLAYALVIVPVIAGLWYIQKFSRKTGYIFLVISTLMGFLVFAPMAPYQFQLAVLGNQQALPVPLVAICILLAIFWILSLVFGRIFCGHVCPIGTIQELVYLVPVKKHHDVSIRQML